MALAQTEDIARRLSTAAPELDVEIVKFETVGDSDQTSKLLMHAQGRCLCRGDSGGRASRQAARRDAFAQGHAGNEDTPGLVIGATLARDQPTDALVLRVGLSIEEFRRAHGKGFKIGTNAVRRVAYARRLFPKVEVIHFRGAADTRVRKLDSARCSGCPAAARSVRPMP